MKRGSLGQANASGGGASVWKLNPDDTIIIPVDNADSWVVGSDRMGQDTADTTKNTRAFFSKAKAAFRAGFANEHWDDANVGLYSSAFGIRPKASGESSHAQGFQTTASGTNSHAEGDSTTASGRNSHAEGLTTTASGNESHAEGSASTASGLRSHAEGQQAVASGDYSHAENFLTTSSGLASHAEGAYSVASRWAQRARAGWRFTSPGDAQVGEMSLLRETINATPTLLIANADVGAILTGTGINVLTLPTSRAFQLKISTVARRTDVQGEMAGWTWEGLVGRDATGNARIIGTPVMAAWGDAPATDPWDAAVSINTTDAANNYVAVTVTGQAGKTIRWVSRMEWIEVAG